MKFAILLFVLLPVLGNAQAACIENHGEEIWLQDAHGDTLVFRGQDFGIASGPESMYRWVVTRSGHLDAVYLTQAGDPLLQILATGPGEYRVTRYTDYYTAGILTGVVESKTIAFTIRTPLEYNE